MEEEVIEKKKSKFILILIGVALLSAATTYVLMTYVFDKKEEKKVYDVEVATKTISKEDPIVTELYEYFDINSGATTEFWENASKMNNNDTLLMSNLDKSTKNYIAFKFLSTDKLSSIKCIESMNTLITGENDNIMACGELDLDENDSFIHTSSTNMVKETDIKDAVEKIFGPNSYSRNNFGKYFSSYVYYEKENAYILFEGIGSVTGEFMLTSLESVRNTSDTLTLNIKLYQEETEAQDAETYGTYDFLYKLANDNYYLYSVKKVS